VKKIDKIERLMNIITILETYPDKPSPDFYYQPILSKAGSVIFSTEAPH